MKDLKKRTLSGIIWMFIDRAGSQFIGFIVTIFLARILSPSDFGLVAMASVVIAITRIFIDSGLRDSLIQKQGCTDVDYSTVFIFNLVLALVFYILIYFTAPAVSRFFGYETLTPVIRVIGLKPIIGSFSLVQTAILHKELHFGKIARIRVPVFIISGVIGLGLAWYGYGVWSLVWQSILEVLLFNLVLWLISSWRPSFQFNKEIFQYHWSHGSRLLVVGALGAVYRNIFSLIIGKFFSPIQLGLYSRAESFRSIILNNTTGLIQTVSYPALSRLQHDNARLKQSYRKIQQITMIALLPILTFFIAGSEFIIELLLTRKWLEAAPILNVLMLSLVFSPFNSINLNVLKVKRRTDLLLRTDLINKAVLVLIVATTFQLGFQFLVWTNLIAALLALFINNYYTNSLISYSLKEQFSDLSPLLVAFILTLMLSWYLSHLLLMKNILLQVILLGVIVITIYSVIILTFYRSKIFTLINVFKSLLIKSS